MENKTVTLTARIPPALADALEAIKVRDGIPISEQLRRALAVWIESKAIGPKKVKRA